MPQVLGNIYQFQQARELASAGRSGRQVTAVSQVCMTFYLRPTLTTSKWETSLCAVFFRCLRCTPLRFNHHRWHWLLSSISREAGQFAHDFSMGPQDFITLLDTSRFALRLLQSTWSALRRYHPLSKRQDRFTNILDSDRAVYTS